MSVDLAAHGARASGGEVSGMPFSSLEDFVARVGDHEEVLTLAGVDLDVEIGSLAEVLAERRGPLLLCTDPLGGSPYRVAVNLMHTAPRFAIAMGIDPTTHPVDIVRQWREIAKQPLVEPVPTQRSRLYDGGSRQFDDLSAIPQPRWHENDGGRYVGTGDMVVIKDPDSDWVNVGTYRSAVVDDRRLTLWIVGSKQGRLLAEKYWSRGQRAPVAIVLVLLMGVAPLIAWRRARMATLLRTFLYPGAVGVGFLLIAAALGVPSGLALTQTVYGIDRKHPLGTFAVTAPKGADELWVYHSFGNPYSPDERLIEKVADGADGTATFVVGHAPFTLNGGGPYTLAVYGGAGGRPAPLTPRHAALPGRLLPVRDRLRLEARPRLRRAVVGRGPRRQPAGAPRHLLGRVAGHARLQQPFGHTHRSVEREPDHHPPVRPGGPDRLQHPGAHPDPGPGVGDLPPRRPARLHLHRRLRRGARRHDRPGAALHRHRRHPHHHGTGGGHLPGVAVHHAHDGGELTVATAGSGPSDRPAKSGTPAESP